MAAITVGVDQSDTARRAAFAAAKLASVLQAVAPCDGRQSPQLGRGR